MRHTRTSDSSYLRTTTFSIAKKLSEFLTIKIFGDFWWFLAHFLRLIQLSGQIAWKFEGKSGNFQGNLVAWYVLSGVLMEAANANHLLYGAIYLETTNFI